MGCENSKWNIIVQRRCDVYLPKVWIFSSKVNDMLYAS